MPSCRRCRMMATAASSVSTQIAVGRCSLLAIRPAMAAMASSSLMASMSLDDANATGSASGMHSRIASRKKSLRRYELAGNGAGFGCATYPMRRWPSWRRNRTASFMARLLSSITDAGRREALRASRATAGICMLESNADSLSSSENDGRMNPSILRPLLGRSAKNPCSCSRSQTRTGTRS